MATIDVASLGMDIKLLTITTIPEAAARPSRAMPMGKPMAITEPKAKTRMMMAAKSPNASLSGISKTRNNCPPYSTPIPSVARNDAVMVLISSATTSISSSDMSSGVVT